MVRNLDAIKYPRRCRIGPRRCINRAQLEDGSPWTWPSRHVSPISTPVSSSSPSSPRLTRHGPSRLDLVLHSRRRQDKECLLITLLPPEIITYILRFLPWGDALRLRTTCSALYNICTFSALRASYRDHDAAFLDMKLTCHVCLQTFPELSDAVINDYIPWIRNVPLSSVCIACARRSRRISVHNQYLPARDELEGPAAVCRWCGVPIFGGVPTLGPFHPGTCEGAYERCWRAFKAKWTVSTILALGGSLFIGAQFYTHPRIPSWAGVVYPLMVFFLWFTIDVGAAVLTPTSGPSRSIVFCRMAMVFNWFALLEMILRNRFRWPPVIMVAVALANICIRFLDLLGILSIVFKYKPWRYGGPGMPAWSKPLRVLLLFLICWVDPRILKLGYIPDGQG